MRGTLGETLGQLARFSRWILLLLLVLYGLSGIYSIAPNEVGILQRFGKFTGDRIPPGIHYALPWPVDRVLRVPIKTVNRIVIDDFFSTAKEDSAAYLFYRATGLASYCISGDNNLVNLQCVIQYTITEPVAYLYQIDNPVRVLRNLAANTLIGCLATMPVDKILTWGKQEIARTVKSRLQEKLDARDTGLTVSFVELSDIKPPSRVERYFSDVVKAKIDRSKMVNDAQSYRNQKIPAAQAESSRINEEAMAYKTEVVFKAEGETDRFQRILERARKKGGSARKTLYLETLGQIMKNVNRKHIIVPDAEGQNPASLRINTPSP